MCYMNGRRYDLYLSLPCLLHPLIFCEKSTKARAVVQIPKLSSRFGYMFNFLPCTWMAGSCYISCLQLSDFLHQPFDSFQAIYFLLPCIY
jgi:hypothetical protein